MKLIQSIAYGLKGLIALSAIYALICIGLSFQSIRQTSLKVSEAASNVTIMTKHLTQDADDMKVMTNAAMFQAEEVLHHTDEVLEVEKLAQTQQLAKVSQVLSRLDLVVKNLDATQTLIAQDLHNTLVPLPSTVEQAQSTLIATQETLASTTKVLVTLNQLEVQLEPTIQHVNDTTSHLDSMSASLDLVIKNATKPQPWYKKVFQYVWAPIKIVAIFAK